MYHGHNHKQPQIPANHNHHTQCPSPIIPILDNNITFTKSNIQLVIDNLDNLPASSPRWSPQLLHPNDSTLQNSKTPKQKSPQSSFSSTHPFMHFHPHTLHLRHHSRLRTVVTNVAEVISTMSHFGVAPPTAQCVFVGKNFKSMNFFSSEKSPQSSRFQHILDVSQCVQITFYPEKHKKTGKL